MKHTTAAACAAVLAAALAGQALTGQAVAADKKTLAFVVNGASDFWKAAEAGVKKAQGELPNYDARLQISRAGLRRRSRSA